MGRGIEGQPGGQGVVRKRAKLKEEKKEDKGRDLGLGLLMMIIM